MKYSLEDTLRNYNLLKNGLQNYSFGIYQQINNIENVFNVIESGGQHKEVLDALKEALVFMKAIAVLAQVEPYHYRDTLSGNKGSL